MVEGVSLLLGFYFPRYCQRLGKLSHVRALCDKSGCTLFPVTIFTVYGFAWSRLSLSMAPTNEVVASSTKTFRCNMGTVPPWNVRLSDYNAALRPYVARIS